MKERIYEIQLNFEKELNMAKTVTDLDTLYLKYLSKTKGITTNLVKELAPLNTDEKKTYGPIINKILKAQKEAIQQAQEAIEEAAFNDPLIDLTIPQPARNAGYLHPLTQITRKMNEFFRYYGFSIVEGPEIETAEYNFRKLNLPEGHPATDLQDTLFVASPNILLRTHTSSIESRILTDYTPPIRAAFPGKCYRNEKPSPTNTPFFHQYQGVVVDKGITIQNLMHTIERAHKFLFGEDTVLRFRYKYYPEVSPGLGVDMQCKFCKSTGCDVCKYRGWIEMLGSGMIHYNTLKMCGIDPEIYTGYAFGMGLDRFALQMAGIPDIRIMYEGDMVYE